MKTSIFALIAAAGVATAGTVIDYDFSGTASWDLEGDADNATATVVLAGSDVAVTAISWDTVLTSVGASWGSEATIGFDFDGDGANDLFLTPSASDTPVAGEANAGSADLVALFGEASIAVGGTVDLEFFETFDDVADDIDNVWDFGSLGFTIPAPGAAALLGMGGLVAARRRR